MQRVIKGMAVVICVGVLMACSKAEDPDDHVFNEQTRALDKARDVENTLRAAEQTRRQQID